MSRDEIVQAVRSCAEKLGRAPTFRELRRLAGVTEQNLQSECGSLKHALGLAGIEATSRAYNLSEEELLLDWAAVARAQQKLPTVASYQAAGRFTVMPFQSRYGKWTQVPQAFRRLAEREEKLRPKWQDVLEMVARKAPEEARAAARPRRQARRSPLLKDRPVYGEPLQYPGLANAPTTEAGVIFAFGMVALSLGYVIERIQPAFPDCEAMWEMAPGQHQRVKIEFELESRNFLKHRHRKDGCEMIVCWRHNWPECPERIEVLELRKMFKKQMANSK
ncbi:MAG TPA: hypothetical protein VJN64_16355 [Terriglobales bacterium]|nr:hypothetical protein [Terriglobales bacterium]